MADLPEAMRPPSAVIDPLQGRARATVDWNRAALGIRRYPRSILVALISAWTLLAGALWLALLAGIAGAVVGGALGGNASASFGAGQAGGIVGAVTGFFVGAAAGFVFVYGETVLVAGPRILISLAVGLAFAFLLTLLIIWVEHWLMYFRGYRPPSRRESNTLAPVIQEVQEAMGLTSLPQFLIFDQSSIGAWTQTRHIVISRRLLDQPSDQLAAVIAHELQHWRSGDSIGLLLVTTCGWPLAFTANVILFIRRVAGKFGGFLTGTLLWPFTVISRFVITPVLALESRRYEYEADAAAVQSGFGLGMLHTLDGLKIFEPARSGWETVVNASHPPTEYRIEAIEEDMEAMNVAPH